MPRTLTVELTERQAEALAITTEFTLRYACNHLTNAGLSKRDLRLALDRVQSARGYHRGR